MNCDTVELHFIDGPLAGTRKMALKNDILQNRRIRHLEPVPYKPEQKVPTYTELSHVQLTCIEWLYIPIPLPRSYNGPDRFAMCLEKGLN